jgi:hypothetical protein
MIDKVCSICPNIGIVYSGMGPDYRVSGIGSFVKVMHHSNHSDAIGSGFKGTKERTGLLEDVW